MDTELNLLLSPEEISQLWVQKLTEIAGNEGDVEGRHILADEALCDLLKVLGYAEVVEIWDNIQKWYA